MVTMYCAVVWLLCITCPVQLSQQEDTGLNELCALIMDSVEIMIPSLPDGYTGITDCTEPTRCTLPQVLWCVSV